ncbi:hypothetical protein NKH89_34855 [Mesorhizobium sp. M0923]|uniref:hypothetical protein n=1 Tax=Mesorhizobium sp. M0923 TaxID=2957028 RepID=UPI0033373D42
MASRDEVPARRYKTNLDANALCELRGYVDVKTDERPILGFLKDTPNVQLRCQLTILASSQKRLQFNAMTFLITCHYAELVRPLLKVAGSSAVAGDDSTNFGSAERRRRKCAGRIQLFPRSQAVTLLANHVCRAGNLQTITDFCRLSPLILEIRRASTCRRWYLKGRWIALIESGRPNLR